VVADDNVTANALATTLCVLSPEDGLRLATSIPGVECLVVAPNGKQFSSPGWKAMEVAALRLEGAQATTAKEPQEAKNGKADAWPEGFGVSLTITLPSITTGKKYRKPYVAVMVENADGKSVRTLSVWGTSTKYLKDLTYWWKNARDDSDLIRAVTRATRSPGKYTLAWDGKDDKGKPLPQGTYTIQIEVSREHGSHVRQTGKIECGVQPATLTLEKNAETEATLVEYAKKK
jgi:hypothetical protein